MHKDIYTFPIKYIFFSTYSKCIYMYICSRPVSRLFLIKSQEFLLKKDIETNCLAEICKIKKNY